MVLIYGSRFDLSPLAPAERDDRLHNAFYQPDEACIGLGVRALSRAALVLLA